MLVRTRRCSPGGTCMAWWNRARPCRARRGLPEQGLALSDATGEHLAAAWSRIDALRPPTAERVLSGRRRDVDVDARTRAATFEQAPEGGVERDVGPQAHAASVRAPQTVRNSLG